MTKDELEEIVFSAMDDVQEVVQYRAVKTITEDIWDKLIEEGAVSDD